MKTIIIGILLATGLFNNLSAQKIVTVTDQTDQFKEVYEVLKSNKKIKHGSYKKFDTNNQLIVEGSFNRNKAIGEWNFYSNQILEQVYDFTSNSSRFPGLDTPPQYQGGKENLNKELNKVIKYPVQSQRMGIEGRVVVIAQLDDNNLYDVEFLSGVSEFKFEVIRSLMGMKKNWIPATKDGKNCKSGLIIVIEFKLGSGHLSIEVI